MCVCVPWSVRVCAVSVGWLVRDARDPMRTSEWVLGWGKKNSRVGENALDDGEDDEEHKMLNS